MSFAVARGAELREALNKPVGVPLPPEADLALLRGAVEAWIKARSQHLNALLQLLKDPAVKPQADAWKTRTGAFKADLKKFGSVLASNSKASVWARSFMSVNTAAEEKFAGALEKAVIAAQARDYMTVYLQTVHQQMNYLEIKWNAVLSRHQSYKQREEAAIDEVKKLISEAAAKARDLETKMVTAVGDTVVKIKGLIERLPEGGADAVQIPANNEVVIAGHATEVFRLFAMGVETQRSRFESYFREEIGSVLFLFRDFREDTKEFIDKFGYKQVLKREEEARRALDAFESSAATSSGNKIDAEQFADAARILVKGHANNAKKTWDGFVTKHEKKFFGPVGPNIAKALLDREVFETKYERLQAENLHQLAEKWRSNIREVWDVDLSGIPDKVADRYRKLLVEKMRSLDEILKRPFLDRFGVAVKSVLDTAQKMILG
jgi:hypothetical protein